MIRKLYRSVVPIGIRKHIWSLRSNINMIIRMCIIKNQERPFVKNRRQIIKYLDELPKMGGVQNFKKYLLSSNRITTHILYFRMTSQKNIPLLISQSCMMKRAYLMYCTKVGNCTEKRIGLIRY